MVRIGPIVVRIARPLFLWLVFVWLLDLNYFLNDLFFVRLQLTGLSNKLLFLTANLPITRLLSLKACRSSLLLLLSPKHWFIWLRLARLRLAYRKSRFTEDLWNFRLKWIALRKRALVVSTLLVFHRLIQRSLPTFLVDLVFDELGDKLVVFPKLLEGDTFVSNCFFRALFFFVWPEIFTAVILNSRTNCLSHRVSAVATVNTHAGTRPNFVLIMRLGVQWTILAVTVIWLARLQGLKLQVRLASQLLKIS